MEKKIAYTFVNEADVLRRLGGNVALFERLFGKFVNTYRTADTQLRDLLAQEAYDEARLLAHSLKGTSANLGITILWNAAADLEKSIVAREAAAMQDKLTAFSTALTDVLREVDSK